MSASRRLFVAHVVVSGIVAALLGRSGASAESVSYTYDSLGRLKTATYSNGVTITYDYDANGNRTTLVQAGSVSPPAPPPPAPQGSLSANPTSITQGGSTTLTWESTNATSVSINNGVGAVNPASGGSVPVSPSATTTYTATITGAGGQITRQAPPVTVNPPSGFNQTIAITGTSPVNLRSLADAAGYNGAQNATVTFTLASGVTISGQSGTENSVGGIGIDTGTWPTGSYTIALTLQVSGKVFGGGGGGGVGATAFDAGGSGGAGGDAIRCHLPLNIQVNAGGEVKAGGGGGGGGASWVNGENGSGGGGGGGGFPNGAGGSGGFGLPLSEHDGSPGANGTSAAGGVGGAHGGAMSMRTPGVGGNGAGAAGVGSAGGAGSGSISGGWTKLGQGGSGGGGYAVRKNGHTVNVTNNGTVTGTIG